jgi:hypothetical protein
MAECQIRAFTNAPVPLQPRRSCSSASRQFFFSLPGCRPPDTQISYALWAIASSEGSARFVIGAPARELSFALAVQNGECSEFLPWEKRSGLNLSA